MDGILNLDPFLIDTSHLKNPTFRPWLLWLGWTEELTPYYLYNHNGFDQGLCYNSGHPRLPSLACYLFEPSDFGASRFSIHSGFSKLYFAEPIKAAQQQQFSPIIIVCEPMIRVSEMKPVSIKASSSPSSFLSIPQVRVQLRLTFVRQLLDLLLFLQFFVYFSFFGQKLISKYWLKYGIQIC